MEQFNLLSLDESLGNDDLLLSGLSLGDQQRLSHNANANIKINIAAQSNHQSRYQWQEDERDVSMNDAPLEDNLQDTQDETMIDAERLYDNKHNHNGKDQDENIFASKSSSLNTPSLGDLFNPTILGAKFAINHQPPPTDVAAESTTSHDIVDVPNIDSQDYESSIRHRNGFVQDPDVEEYTYDLSSNDKQPSKQQSQNQEHQLNQTQPSTNWYSTFVVHHHHYYGGSSNEGSQQQLSTEVSKQRSPFLPHPWSSSSSPSFKMPYLISSYLQILLNSIATIFLLNLGYQMIQTVKHDIKLKIGDQINDSKFEIELCKRQYVANNCDPLTMVPALSKQCAEWESCMRKNPYFTTSYSNLSAEILGSLVNSLLEPIGYKSFALLIGFCGAFYFFNFGCGFFKAKSYYGLGQKKLYLGNSSTSEDDNTGNDSQMVWVGR